MNDPTSPYACVLHFTSVLTQQQQRNTIQSNHFMLHVYLSRHNIKSNNTLNRGQT